MRTVHATPLIAAALLGLGLLIVDDEAARPTPAPTAVPTSPARTGVVVARPALAAPEGSLVEAVTDAALAPEDAIESVAHADERDDARTLARAALEAWIASAAQLEQEEQVEGELVEGPPLDLETALYTFVAEHPDHGPALLLEAAQDPTAPDSLRVAAVTQLGHLGAPEVEAALVELLARERTDDVITPQVYLALATSPAPSPTVLETLRRDATDHDAARARWAISAVGLVAAGADDPATREGAVDALLGLLPGSDPDRAEALLFALGGAADPRAAATVLRHTHAVSPVERAAAASALGALAAPGSAARLAELARRDPDEQVRRAALQELAATPPTVDGLQALEGALHAEQVEVRQAGLDALGRWQAEVEPGSVVAGELARLLQQAPADLLEATAR